jgi:phosphoribosylpyrophosphate synthetase
LALVEPLCALLLYHSVSSDDGLWFVPAAGGIKSLQRRGYSPATLIAKSLLVGFDAEARKSAGPRALIWGGGLVWRKHEVADQAGLSGFARQTNLVGAMQASSGVANKSIVLVDDIVTTGSTLFETARALRAEGATVLGFVTFAETVLRSFAKSDAID